MWNQFSGLQSVLRTATAMKMELNGIYRKYQGKINENVVKINISLEFFSVIFVCAGSWCKMYFLLWVKKRVDKYHLGNLAVADTRPCWVSLLSFWHLMSTLLSLVPGNPSSFHYALCLCQEEKAKLCLLWSYLFK